VLLSSGLFLQLHLSFFTTFIHACIRTYTFIQSHQNGASAPVFPLLNSCQLSGRFDLIYHLNVVIYILNFKQVLKLITHLTPMCFPSITLIGQWISVCQAFHLQGGGSTHGLSCHPLEYNYGKVNSSACDTDISSLSWTHCPCLNPRCLGMPCSIPASMPTSSNELSINCSLSTYSSSCSSLEQFNTELIT